MRHGFHSAGWCLAGLMLLLVGCTPSPPADTGVALDTVLGGEAQSGFARAEAPYDFQFPEDHNAHPDFRNEWWYIIGNLNADTGEAFGYQLTFFRAGVRAGDAKPAAGWSSNAFWMAHFAVTDIAGQTHHHASRFARDGRLAGQTSAPFAVWLDDWRLSALDPDADAALPWRLQARADDMEIDIVLNLDKPIVLNGDAGLSHKGGAAGNASYYYSATRLGTRGELELDGRRHRVAGESWLDREWSTSALAEGTVGWDWFSLQLDTGHDLMLYQLREADGTTHPASAGTQVAPDGEATHLSAADYTLTPLRVWTASDGREYPVSWRVEVPSLSLDAVVEARVDAQWMNTAVVYWEGAVEVRDSDGRARGVGYLEMTGY